MKVRVLFSALLVIVLSGSLLTPLAATLESTDTDAGPSLDELRGMVQKGLITVEEYKAAVAAMAPASPGTVLVGAGPEAVLLAEDFETWPPPGWTIVDNGGDCVWDSNTFYARPNYAGGDGQCADADADECGSGTTMDTELQSPLIDLSGALPGTVLQFVGAYDDLGDGDYAEVLISPDGGTNWNQELYWNEPHSPSGPGEVVVIDMTPYLGSSEVVISFHYVAGWDWYFEVDQVRVQSPAPDLSESTKEVWPASAAPGDVLTYTVHISNTGDAPAWQAVMTDAVPAGTAYVADSVDCSFGDCWYDAADDAVYWNQGVPPARYFVANYGSTNTVWEIDLIRAGLFVEDTWGVVNTCSVAGIGDNVGIDYDAQNGVLYHSDYNSTNIVVTDLECNVLGSFTCAGDGVTRNTGVTYVEGSQPPEVWVTDFGSETTTRCEALLQQGAPAAPPPVAVPDTDVASLRELNDRGLGAAAPGDFIEQFPVDWAIGVIGLVYDPSRDWVRYAHESDPNDPIWDVERPVPHTVLGSCALSAVNPGWPSTLDDKDGAGYDFLADTYFLPDFNGDQVNRDDNIVEIDAQCNILNAWETAGIENDSYDGSVINTIMDIAVVPNPPPPEEVVVTFQVEVLDVPCGEPVVNEAVITDPQAPDVVMVQAETLIVCPDITVDPPSLLSDQCPDEQMTSELSICNEGNQVLEWGVTEGPEDIPWLSEDPISGTVLPDGCQVVDVTFDTTGLAPGGYDGSLAVVSNDPDTPTTTLPISLTVLGPVSIADVAYMTDTLQVTFDATVEGAAPFMYAWDFGDGGTSDLEDPVHTYADEGCYTVTFTATNACAIDVWSDEVCVEIPFLYFYLPMRYKNH